MGDTIRISPGTYTNFQTFPTIQLKQTVQVIAPSGGVEIVGSSQYNSPVISAVNHTYPATIDGVTIRQQTGTLDTYRHGVLVDDSPIILKNCTIRDTRAFQGAGIYATGRSNVILENCEIRDTSTGGGLVLSADAGGKPTATVTGCTFRSNTNVTILGCGAVGIFYDSANPLQGLEPKPYFENCVFEGNLALDGGAAVKVANSNRTIVFQGCRFVDNSCYVPGGAVVLCSDARVLLDRCTVAGNTMDCPSGCEGYIIGAVGVHDFAGLSMVTLQNCIVAFNGGPAVHGHYDDPPTASVSNSVLFGNVSGSGLSDSDWVAAGQSVVNMDPAFCNAANGDYHLYAFSPAAAGPHYPERVGALDVGCVPGATVTVATTPHIFQPGDYSVTPACPKNDAARVVVSLDFENAVMTRRVGASEIRLDTADFHSRIFLPVNASISADSQTSANEYKTTISHGGFGGHGIDDVDILLNGVPLGPKAHIDIRTPDFEAPYGNVNLADFAKFAADYFPYPSPPSASPQHTYTQFADFNGDGIINLNDYAFFGTHYGHASPYGPINGPTALVQSIAHVALQFTVEYVTPLTRRLYADVDLENIGGVSACVFSLRRNRNDLSLAGWAPAEGAMGSVLFTEADRDGEDELFFGILAAQDFTGASSHLGRLVFEVEGTQTLAIGEDQFILTVGDIQAGSANGVSTVGQMSGVLGRAFDPSIRQVFHNDLEQNFPNPFNPQTTIAFSIKDGASVGLTIYDVAGRRVRELVDEHRAPGAYRIVWDGRSDSGSQVASGVYFYKLVAGSFTDTKKMTILK